MKKINLKGVMKTKNCYLFFFLIGTIFFASQTTFAQDKDLEVFNDDIEDIMVGGFYHVYLVGIKKVKIFISDLPKELEENGVTKDQLQTEAEIRLRRAGIYDEKAASSLNVKITVTESKNDYVIYVLEFSLDQPARLERNNLPISTKTWGRSNVGSSEKNRIQIDIRERVGKYIDKFIKDLRTANSQTVKKNTLPTNKQVTQQKSQTKTAQQGESPFKAVYVGGNVAPTIEVFNDTDRTMYFDFGQEKMTAYTIPSGKSQKITVPEGIYNFKASAPRVRSDEGQETFNKGYAYTWRFYIVTVPR